MLYLPKRGVFAAEDSASKKRKEIAEKLKKGQKVNVTEEGTLIDPNSPEGQEQKRDGKELKIPDGKLASFHWYERKPELFQAEKQAMRESFPHFRLDKLDDGRYCWIGTLKPCGDDDITWTLMAVYDHDHPNNNTYGGSVKIYSVDPDLQRLQSDLGQSLPHVLRDGAGNLYMCTARQEDVDAGKVITSASSALRWAVKWTFVVTCWMNGDVGDEIYAHTF